MLSRRDPAIGANGTDQVKPSTKTITIAAADPTYPSAAPPESPAGRSC